MNTHIPPSCGPLRLAGAVGRLPPVQRSELARIGVKVPLPAGLGSGESVRGGVDFLDRGPNSLHSDSLHPASTSPREPLTFPELIQVQLHVVCVRVDRPVRPVQVLDDVWNSVCGCAGPHRPSLGHQ